MTFTPIDESKSIEELKGFCWLDPDFGSAVVLKSYALRRKPLADLSCEDLRVSLIQQIGLDYTVPLAINLVENDPSRKVCTIRV